MNSCRLRGRRSVASVASRPPISHPSKGDVKSQTLQNTQHTLKPTLGGICLDIYAHGNPMLKTLNNGYLGSRNDEERNQMRYVMRSVQLVSHRIFERTLRSRLRPRACLPERQPKPSSPTLRFGSMDLAVPDVRRRTSGSAEAQRRGRLGPFAARRRKACSEPAW